MHRLDPAGIAPPAEVLPDIGVGREVMRQVAPLAAGAPLIEDGVPDLAQRISAWPTGLAAFGLGKHRPDLLPLRIRQVTRVTLSLHTPVLPHSRLFLYTLLDELRTFRWHGDVEHPANAAALERALDA